MVGKLKLVTNAQGLTPRNWLPRYKLLADIQRSFKVLKSEIEVGFVYPRLPERIQMLTSISCIALVRHRVMLLCVANARRMPERALEQLRRSSITASGSTAPLR